MRKIGITGGIGSGKSFVSQILREEFNIPVYDCDAEAKRLTATNAEIRSRLQNLVGADVFSEDGALNKPVLANYLFASAEHADKVNAIIHPVVRNDFRAWSQRQTSQTVAMESAILCESGFDTEVDDILFVDASSRTRLTRAMKRDGAKEEQIKARMAQQDEGEARTKARWIIRNEENTTKENIIEQIKKIELC